MDFVQKITNFILCTTCIKYAQKWPKWAIFAYFWAKLYHHAHKIGKFGLFFSTCAKSCLACENHFYGF